MEHFDVIVVGGGAAGMMAAGTAALRGKSVLLLEKNSRLGEKLSITGGGRCNIVNADFDLRSLLSQYGEAEQFLYSIYTRFGVKKTISFFESIGLPIVIEDLKRAFPRSQSAQNVTDVLARWVRQSGVTVRVHSAVTKIHTENGEVRGVTTNAGTFLSERIILSTGGVSRKETGSTGDGFRWLKKIGHTVARPDPDIVPLRVSDSWVRKLSGLSLQSVKVSFSAEGARAVKKEGRILFTHFGLSGPLIMNSAREVKKLLEKGPVTVSFDLHPKKDIGALDVHILSLFNANKNKMIKNVLGELVPKALIPTILSFFPQEFKDRKVHSVLVPERKHLVKLLKQLSATVEGLMGNDWAVISDGGVPLNEMNMRTLESEVCKGLFVVGDLLHINRPSGGFSLQLSWTTGRIAGEEV